MVAAAVGALAIAGAVAASAGSERRAATPDERAVCGSIQTVIDGLNQRNNAKALGELGQLEASIADTTNERLAEAGQLFFEVVGANVDAGSLTVEETARAGMDALEKSATALDKMLAECESVGLAIHNLPTQPRDRFSDHG